MQNSKKDNYLTIFFLFSDIPLDRIDLYKQHWPYVFPGRVSNIQLKFPVRIQSPVLKPVPDG